MVTITLNNYNYGSIKKAQKILSFTSKIFGFYQRFFSLATETDKGLPSISLLFNASIASLPSASLPLSASLLGP